MQILHFWVEREIKFTEGEMVYTDTDFLKIQLLIRSAESELWFGSQREPDLYLALPTEHLCD